MTTMSTKYENPFDGVENLNPFEDSDAQGLTKKVSAPPARLEATGVLKSYLTPIAFRRAPEIMPPLRKEIFVMDAEDLYDDTTGPGMKSWNLVITDEDGNHIYEDYLDINDIPEDYELKHDSEDEEDIDEEDFTLNTQVYLGTHEGETISLNEFKNRKFYWALATDFNPIVKYLEYEEAK